MPEPPKPRASKERQKVDLLMTKARRAISDAQGIVEQLIGAIEACEKRKEGRSRG